MNDTTARAARVGWCMPLDTGFGSGSTTTPDHRDVRIGTLVQRPAEQCGDVLVKDRDGQWTYQLAVTVDDLDQDVSLVVRGEDLIESTGGSSRWPGCSGGREPPVFLHHPLIYASPGVKLSKSAGDSAVRALRAAGVRPEVVVGWAAAAVGSCPTARCPGTGGAPDRR